MSAAYRGRIGRAVIGGFASAGIAILGYVVTIGLDPITPVWAWIIAIVFPPMAALTFAWYLWWSRDHEHRSRLCAYAGIGSVLGGIAFLAPGSGLVVQQTIIGRPVINVEVYFAESWLGGGLVGLVTGHFYAIIQAERVRLERRETELEESRQRLSVLNRVLRHDIRNQMNVLLGNATQLAHDEDDASFEDVKRTVQKVLEISENARQIESVIQEERSPPEPKEITSLVESAVDQARSRFPEAEFEIGGLEAGTVASNGHLESMVRNLLENAVEHNDADTPTVKVTVAVPDEEWATLRVADNGPGIPETERAVFDQERETQLEHSNGLGLWLARWITRDIGGELRLENRDPRGARVTVRLPRASADTTIPDA